MRALLLTAALLLPQAPTPLAHLRDKARPVLIFTPSVTDPRFLAQLHQFEPHTAALAERQVVVLVFPQHPGPWQHPPDHTVWPDTTPDPTRTRAIYRIAPGDFNVILVGKDGGEKLRTHHPLSFSTLADTIDAMPMRQQEMRR